VCSSDPPVPEAHTAVVERPRLGDAGFYREISERTGILPGWGKQLEPAYQIELTFLQRATWPRFSSSST